MVPKPSAGAEPHAAPAPARPLAARLLVLLFFLSGSCGLGYQIVWTRMWAVGLGHEVPSMLAVVAAFFAGLALGSWLLDGPVSRSSRPGRWYVGLELVLGLWALTTPWTLPLGNELVARLTGVLPSPLRQWLVAFGLPCLFLLPATAAMGATLPAMDRFFGRVCASGRHVGALYAANTLGAVAGTLASAFVLVPRLGMTRTVLVFAGLNLFCGAAVALGYARGEERLPVPPTPSGPAAARARLHATLFGTGLLGIGFEVVGVRVVGQVLENTVYSFACALAVYLVGTALGAALYQRLGRGRLDREGFERLLRRLLVATSFACLGGVLAMTRSREVYGAVLGERGGFGPAIAAELAVAASVFLVPTLLFGATFSHLAQGARRPDGGVGSAFSVNTLGGALAPFVFGVLLLPALGSRWTLIAIAAGYLALVPGGLARRLVPAVGVALAVLVLPADLRLVTTPPGGRLLAEREGVMANVAVVADAEGNRLLKVNDHFYMGGSTRGFAARRSGHIPLLLHPDPGRALFLGMGAGTTFSAAGWHPGLEAGCVELLPGVVAYRERFATQQDRFVPERMSVLVADARRFVRAETGTWDVIVADLFHPARDGAGSLYTLEHFRAVKSRLAPGGLFCQWLPLYQLDPETRDVVVRTFLAVFEHAEAWLSDFNVTFPVLGLVGRLEPAGYVLPRYERRVGDPELRRALGEVALANDFQLFGCYVGGRAELERLAGEGPLDVDDLPLVTYIAPRPVYAGARPAERNLRDLLEGPRASTDELLAPDTPPELARRLAAYWTARDRYLAAELEEDDVAARLALLVESVETSPDFATGYYVCLLEAESLAGSRPDLARRLLDALVAAQPARPEARELRLSLFGR